MKTTIVYNGVTGVFVPNKSAKPSKAEQRHSAIKATMTNATNVARASSHNAATRKIETLEAGQNLLAQFKNMTASQASEQLRAICPALDYAHPTFTPANMPSLFTASKGAALSDYQVLMAEGDSAAYDTIHEKNSKREKYLSVNLDAESKEAAIVFNGSLLDLSIAYDVSETTPALVYCTESNNYYKITPHLRGLIDLQSKHAQLVTAWTAKREAAAAKKEATLETA